MGQYHVFLDFGQVVNSNFHSITPWVTNMGLQNAFILAAFAGLAQVLTFLILVKYGRTLRRRSVGRYKRHVKDMAEAGLVH